MSSYAMTFSRRREVPAFSNAILNIGEIIPKKKMLWIHASSIVTGMTDRELVGDRTVEDDPGCAVGTRLGSIIVKLTIAQLIQASGKIPAAISILLYARFKSCFWISWFTSLAHK